MTNNKINTDLTHLVSALREKGEIKLPEAAAMLGLPEHETENLIKKLAEYKIIEMHYSMKGHKILKIGPNASEEKEKNKEARTKHQVSAHAEKAFNVMRHKIAEKRGQTAGKAAGENGTETDNERQKRLQEIRDGLISVRENLESIRNALESDLKNKNDSYYAQTDACLIGAK
jgi:hypothetical protein